MLSVPALWSQRFALTVAVTRASSQLWQEILSEMVIEAHLGYSRQFYIAQAQVLINEQTQSVAFLCDTQISVCFLPEYSTARLSHWLL